MKFPPFLWFFGVLLAAGCAAPAATPSTVLAGRAGGPRQSTPGRAERRGESPR